MGSESDNAKYPQCEIVIRWNVNKSSDTQYYFNYKDQISKNINKVFRLLNESYALNQKIPETIFNLPDDITPISQYIDNYGRCRRVNVKYKGHLLTISTNPMPPLPIAEDNKEFKVDIKIALDFLTKINIKPIKQTVIDRKNPKVISINSILGNVNINIPVNMGTIINDVDIEFVYDNSENNTSAMKTFNFNKKMVRYITEYVFWLFSNYLNDNKVENITEKVLAKFAQKTFQIDSKVEYKLVPKIFGKNNSLMKDGKLIVKSEEMLKRLMYVLKLYSMQDINTLRSYYKRNSISNYYVDITDFETYPNQVLLQGEDALDKWLSESKVTMKLNSGILLSQSSPYFFKNEKVHDEKIFLAQNVNSLENAISVSMCWQKYGFNNALDIEEKYDDYSFTLYKYINADNITPIQVIGNKKIKKHIRILGYKLAGTPFYTVLLDFDNEKK
jgi:hypothetical protein